MVTTQNSWGYDSLSFEARAGTKVSKVSRPKVNWRKNTPGYRDLAAGGRMDLRINPGDLVVPSKGEEIRAVYAPKAEPEAERCQVWRGKSLSKWVNLPPDRA